MTGMAPTYPAPYVLFSPHTHRPILSGPNGEGGYGSPGINTSSWVQPDGRRAWYYPNRDIDQANRVALGLDRYWSGDNASDYGEIFAVFKRHAASDAQADIGTAVVLAESAGHFSAHNVTASTGDDSIGWGQINLLAHGRYRSFDLYDVDNNVAAIKDVSSNYTNWQPWTTFRNGAHKKYLRGTSPPPSSPPTTIPGAPPVAEPGPPVTPAPKVPTGDTSGGHHGPVRTEVDRFIAFVPDIPLIGGAIRNGLHTVLDPMADLVDEWIQILAGDIQGVIKFAGDAASDALTYAEDLIQHAEDLAARGLHDLAAYTGGLIRSAINEAESLVRDAERLADAGLHSLAAYTAGLIRSAIDRAETLVRDAESIAERGLTALAHVTAGLIQDAIEEAETLVRDAEHLADAGTQALARLTASLIRDAIDEAETLVHGAEHAADAALKALIRDVVDPIKTELEHLVSDVLGPAETVLKDLVKAAEWIAWLATHPFELIDDIRAIPGSLSPDSVIEAVKRGDYSLNGLRGQGFWGVE